MTGTDLDARIRELAEQRASLETSPSQTTAAAYDALQKRLAGVFRDATTDAQRIDVMLEMMRVMENRLVYLQDFTADATSDQRMLAKVVTRFIDQLAGAGLPALTKLEATYYRAVAALYAGDLEAARAGFRAACESEESDETNDIKYKSYVILGNLSHEERDYEKAKELHHESIRYAQHPNITAQALALKALNSYALKSWDEALHLFREALQLFNPNEPFFNSYFYRNALAFCGAIHFDRHEYDEAEHDYRQVLDSVEQSSYDFFDALTHLGRIYYAEERYDDAAAAFERAVQTHRVSENEYLVDTWFWIARCHMKRNDPAQAREYLEKIAATDVKYEKKPQAIELLQKIA